MDYQTFDRYMPTELELWINGKYKRHGIHRPADMHLDHIAPIFNASIVYTKGETKVMFDDLDCLIFLKDNQSLPVQRAACFHEFSHPALHVGNQNKLPPSFVQLQEVQADHFLMYASMPIYMIQDHINEMKYESLCIESFRRILAEEFCLPHNIVHRRIEQIMNRLFWLDKEEAIAEVTTIKQQPDHVKHVLADLEHRRTLRKEREKEGYYAIQHNG